MDDTQLEHQFAASLCTRSVFRVVRRGLSSSRRRPYGLSGTGHLSSENPTWPATWGMARYHMLHSHIPTPFISVFNNYRRALNWAGMLEQRGIDDIDILVIDTYDVPSGQLWDAHRLAVHMGFPQWRIGFHENEYLFYGSIACRRILAVIPATGRKIPIPVHLGTLTLPQSFIDTIELDGKEPLKMGLFREVYIRCGTWDSVRHEQTMHALCTLRLDTI